MNREELTAYLTETYSTTGEYLFARYPNFQVFRHNRKKKWFVVIMDIPGNNLGLDGEKENSNMKERVQHGLAPLFVSNYTVGNV